MIHKIDCPILVNKFTKHLEYKEQLLEIINTSHSGPDYDGSIISRTDWNVNLGEQRQYWNLIFKDLNDIIYPSFKEIGYEDIRYENCWFQQYNTNEFHKWHRHPGCQWSNVYYVELPEGTPATMFRNPYDQTEFTIDVEEGDIISFPSIVQHTSPINASDKVKTVIAFNLSNY
jgi:hypothetical protein